MAFSKFVPLISIALACSVADAQMHFLTQDSKLYKFQSGKSITALTLKLSGTEVHGFSSLAFDPSGALWGSADTGVYTINTATGALTKKWDLSANHNTATFDFFNNNGVTEWVAFVHRNENNTNAISRWNTSTATYIGGYDLSGASDYFATSALNPANGRYYAVHGNDMVLRYFDVLTGPPGGVAVGSTGLSPVYNAGGAWFNGQYYNAFRAQATSPVTFGRLSTTTGAFTSDFSVSQADIPFADGMGYAVAAVPEPCSVAAFGLGTILFLKRRKK